MTALPSPRPRVKAQVAHFLGLARSSEEQLLDALVLFAERHSRDFDLSGGATIVASWPRDHIERLKLLVERYGAVPSDQPERLRAALLSGTRMGAAGSLHDLQDLSLLAEQVSMAWTILFQGGKELHDDDLLALSADAREHTRRTLQWLRTQIEHQAPETLAVAVDPRSELAASLPEQPSVAAIPDPVWAPFVSAGLVLIVGLAGLLVGRPWLLPSLGPTAALQAENPAHPTSRMWNVVAGHLGGLVAGFAGVLLFRAQDTPVVLAAKVLPPERVGAAVVAVGLTILFGMLLRASHPPAAATTLLVALGSIATLADVLNLVAGVAVIALVGEAIRRVRLNRRVPAERRAPARGRVTQALRG